VILSSKNTEQRVARIGAWVPAGWRGTVENSEKTARRSLFFWPGAFARPGSPRRMTGGSLIICRQNSENSERRDVFSQ
jgi:hypothetical protein